MDNWTGSKVGGTDISIPLPTSPFSYPDMWVEMDQKTSESLIWVGNNQNIPTIEA